jgi:Vitamin K-dependent gamma-carboxylase
MARALGGLLDSLRALATGRYPAGPVALFRIAGAIVALLDLFSTWDVASLIWGTAPDLGVVDGAYTVWAIVLVLLLVGYRTTLMAVLNLLLVFPLIDRIPPIFEYHLDYYLHAWAFYLVLMQPGRALSIDSLRARFDAQLAGTPPPDRTVPRWPVTLFMVQLALDYFDAGWFKWNDVEMWRQGMGLYWPLVVRYGSTGAGRFILDWEPIILGLGYTAFYWELTFPLLMLWRPLRIVAIAFGVLFHVGIVLLLPIHWFGELMVALYFLFLPWSWVERAWAFLSVRLTTRTVNYDPSCTACARRAAFLKVLDPQVRLAPGQDHLRGWMFGPHQSGSYRVTAPSPIATGPTPLALLTRRAAAPALAAGVAFLLITKLGHIGILPEEIARVTTPVARTVNGFVVHPVFMAFHFRRQQVLQVETLDRHGKWTQFPFMREDGYPDELPRSSTRIWVYLLRVGLSSQPEHLAQVLVRWIERTRPDVCAVRLSVREVRAPERYQGDVDVWSEAPERRLGEIRLPRDHRVCRSPT